MDHAFDCTLPPVRIDLEMAGRFLDALETDGLFTFQTYADKKEGSAPFLTRVINGRANVSLLMDLAYLNQHGAGIFVTVNRTDGRGRKKHNIVSTRALFVDADDKPRPQWHRQPDLVAYRDATHWHAYWLCQALALDEFEHAQKRLARHYGTDASIFDCSRVMRVPGFLHQKGEPRMVQFDDWRNAA